MAYNHTATHGSDFPHRVFEGVKSFFAMVGTALVLAGTTNHRLHEVERLNAKSDDQLATMGIRREDIVRYVFRDMLDT